MTDSGRSRTVSLFNALLFAVVAAFCVVWSGAASAVTVSGLYTVDVPVEGSSASNLSAGYAEGLSRVLVRVSGTRDVLSMDGIDDILGNAESLLLSYQVRREDGESRLQMSFGAVGVNRALAAIGAPVWGANRPLTLAWIAVQDGGARSLLTSAADDSAPSEADGGADEWRRAFARAAAARGLPVAFPPRPASQDRELLSDLWGQFIGRIQEASGDLSHDVLALMRVSRSGSQWRAGWVFEGMGMDPSEQSVSADTPDGLAEAVINQWAEQYARRYAVAAEDVDDAPRVDIMVEGVRSIADYGQVTRALAGFTPVTSVGASRVRGDRLTVQVTFNGELDQLKEYMALDARFSPLSAEAMGDANVRPAQENRPESAAGAADSSSGPSPEPDGEASAPESEGAAEALSEDGESLFVYQPLMVEDEQDAEQAFESLYQVLYYRWQPATVIDTPGDR